MNGAGMGMLGKAPPACYGRSGHLEDHAQEESFMSSFDLILQSSGAFDWNQGLLVLAMTAVVLGGLVGMEAVHQGRRRARRASPSARPPLSPAAPFSPAPPAPAAIARQQQAMVAPA